MNKLAELKRMEAEKAVLLQRIDSMREKMGALMEMAEQVTKSANEKGVSTRDLALAICPELEKELSTGNRKAVVSRRPRQLKTYINPHTKEEVQTKGGNHKVLRQWKDEYGDEAVQSWQVV